MNEPIQFDRSLAGRLSSGLHRVSVFAQALNFIMFAPSWWKLFFLCILLTPLCYLLLLNTI